MQYDAFRSWLASRGIKADAINTRSYSVRKVDTSLAALGLPYSSLDDAWKAGEANAIDQRLKDLLSDIDNGDETYRTLLPETQKPESRLRNFRSWVRQYWQFLEEQSGSAKFSDWPELERMRDEFLERAPDFQSFQVAAGSYYENERRYKDEIITVVADAVSKLSADPEALGREIVSAMLTQTGPLLRWQTIDRFQGEFEALAPTFFAAIGNLAISKDPQTSALMDCINELRRLSAEGVTSLKRGEILSITLSVAACVDPQRSAPFKIRIAQQLARRLLPTPLFTDDSQTEADIAAWLELQNRIFAVMRDVWGWAPKDLFDVQGFTWVVLNPAYQTHEDPEMADIGSEPTEQAPNTEPPRPQNLILYGPPGTGKTFSMAEIAVRLCDGQLPGNADTPDYRTQIQQRYEELRQRGRIEFITFHQSFSYEEFVEGLRPDTGAGDEDGGAAGFRLRPEDGVFRRIAKLAERAKAPSTRSASRLNRTSVFKASLGPTWDEAYAYLFEECIDNGYILLGYGGEVDWSDDRFLNFETIRAEWNKIDPAATGSDPNIKSVYTLRAAMKEGDLVVISNGNLRFRAIGRITGPYEHVRREQDQYHHRRKVEWLWVDRGEGLSHSEIYDKRFSQQALYKMVDAALKWPAIEEIVSGGQTDSGPAPGYVLIIDEINRANISKVFGELITLVEPDKRLGGRHEQRVRLPYSKEEFGVPANLHILGTMNTADRSIALLDTALRRRFDFQEMMPRPELLSQDVGGVNLRSVLETLNERIEYLFDRDHQIGHACFMDCRSRSDVNDVLRRKVIPLLVEYFYEDWEKVRRVLGETKDEGSFIVRRPLRVPGSNQNDYEEDKRYRYTVRDVFPDSAYEQIGS